MGPASYALASAIARSSGYVSTFGLASLPCSDQPARRRKISQEFLFSVERLALSVADSFHQSNERVSVLIRPPEYVYDVAIHF
jgi:hypothetical protein